MDADQVRAYVAAKWPAAMQSPLAQAMHAASTLTHLEAGDADDVVMRAGAMEHAEACLRARDGWTVETLSNNISSSFGLDLGDEVCNEIAEQAIAKARACCMC